MPKNKQPKKDFLVFGAPNIGDDEIDEVVDSLTNGWPGTGPKVARFENDFKSYKAANHAVAVNSCTAALHLSVLSLGIQPGDEIITTPLTFCATANAIIHGGATPVLADVDPISMNLDPGKVESKLSDNTVAILPVHFAGRACNMEALVNIANQHELRIIEDCAHAVETEYKGQKAGTIGDFGCFSFYSTKNIITVEGGMVLARKEENANRIKNMALHGMSKDAWKRFGDEGFKHYQVVECGYKYNMMDIQAAIGIHQLKRVETSWERRKEIWERYNNAFKNLPIGLPAAPEQNTRHAYHLYTIMLDKGRASISRDEFLNEMTQHGIGVGVHYLSLPEHTYYQKRFGWKPEDYPNAMKIGRQTVSLPLSPKLTDENVEDVISTVKNIIS